MGQNVMVSAFREFYKLVDFFGQFKLKKLRLVIGVPTFEKVLDKKYYADLKGGILEAVGKMFPSNMKLYLYPTVRKESGEVITADNLSLAEDVRFLLDYLRHNRFILDLKSSIGEQLHVRSSQVLEMILKGDPKWENYVPMLVAQAIKKKKLFGFVEEKKKKE
jgi:hypothetical protein